MNKCVITGQETVNKKNNIPLSIEGRLKLAEIHSEFNQKAKEGFLEEQVTNGTLSQELAEKLAPQFSKAHVLKMIARDSVEGLFATLERAKSEVKEQQNEAE